jgi:hypothetical protein
LKGLTLSLGLVVGNIKIGKNKTEWDKAIQVFFRVITITSALLVDDVDVVVYEIIDNDIPKMSKKVAELDKEKFSLH